LLEEKMTKSSLTIEERFWEKVDIRGPDECWVWLAGKTSKGYGTLWLKGTSHLAHRVAWELTNGEIPEGICVLHHCDNPPCCNPKCFFLGTRADNVADRDKKGRRADTKGISHPRAKLSNEQVLEIRDLRSKGMLQREIAELYPISQQMINHICRRENWKHI
jgi:hypothetical protein